MNPQSTLPLLAKLDAHDRALMARFVIEGDRRRVGCRSWCAITHLGGARISIALTLLLLAIVPNTHFFARAAFALAGSHIFVRNVKRFAGRARPTETMSFEALVVVPDKFSFPSGHSCAATSVAIAYAICFPAWAPIILLLAFVVGVSRVALGVHFPGDVVVGQLIAVVFGILAFSF